MSRNLQSLRRSWRHHFSLQLATLLVMSASIFTVIVFTSLYLNMESVLTMWGQNLQMTVYLDPQVSDSQISHIKAVISSEAGVQSHSFVSADEAVRRFQTQVGSYAPDLFSEQELAGLVPSSFELSLADSVMSTQPLLFMREFSGQIIELAGVEDVSYGQEWVQKYRKIIQFLLYMGTFLVVLLLLGCIFVTGNSIRVAMQQRRDEIEILELIGATTEMIRRPFIIEGAITGLTASILALLMAATVFWLATNAFSGQLAFVGLRGQVTFLPPLYGLGFLLGGAVIGALGAWLCVRRLNDGWLASQRVS